MSFSEVVIATKKYFPDLHIKYKNESLIMRLLGILLFFHKDFMTYHMTTIGRTIYIPSKNFVKIHPIVSIVLFLYKLACLRVSKKNSYLSTLYVIQQLSRKKHFTPHLEVESKNFILQLCKYQLLYNHSLEKEFEDALCKIKAGQKPFKSPVFDMLDDLLTKA